MFRMNREGWGSGDVTPRGGEEEASSVTFADALALARSEEPPGEREARGAIATAGGLYFVGALLCATAVLLPHVSSPLGVTAVGLDAMLTAALLLLLAASRGWGGLGLACVADLWGIVLIAVLCASSGGPESPFALIYFFALGHAAAFQPRARFVLVSVVGLIAFLAPLAYEPYVPSTFGAVACVGIVLALLASLVVHSSLNRLREQRRRLRFLIAATATLDRSLDPAETLRTIAHMAVPELAELCVIDLLDQSGSVASTVAASVDPAIATGVERMREAFPLDMRSAHPVAQVLAGNERWIVSHVSHTGAAQAAQSDEHERFMRDAGYTWAAVFPMIARGRTRGAISFLRLHDEVRFDRNMMPVLEDLAGRAAMAFDNARLYAERAQVARTLRRSLMPPVLPVIPGLELASYFRPSGAGSEVGGDFYDVFGDRDSCWLVVGDVCGKGAEAAALTGFLRHTIAAYARDGGAPGGVLSQVNRAMLEHDFEGRFATAILVRMCARGAALELTLALAGHPAALVIRGDGRGGHGQVAELGGVGALLGVFADPSIEEVRTTLEPGDRLALYTDGYSEAHAPARVVTVGEMIEQLELTEPASASDTIEALLALIGPDDGVRDDIAILSAQVSAAAGA
jgi:Stage II sporulation protein E (SpoIIE)/GAF domain